MTGEVPADYDGVVHPDGGGGDREVVRRGTGPKPAVKPGEAAAFDGTFDLVAVLDPAPTDCKQVADLQAKK